jgi:hypothetical protein
MASDSIIPTIGCIVRAISKLVGERPAAHPFQIITHT